MKIKTLQECETEKDDQNNYEYSTLETVETQGDMEDDMEAQQDNRKEENEDIWGNKQDPKDDELSIEDESPEDSHLTLYNINIVKQMNTAKSSIDPETGEEVTEDCP